MTSTGWLGAGLVAYGVYYLTRPGRSLGTLGADVLGLAGSLSLTAEQDVERRRIEAAFGRAGMAFLGPAAVANAYAESRLDPAAIGDAGRSVGLFQLHDAGAGAGMSVEQRQDPDANTARIIQEARRFDWPFGLSHFSLAGRFAELVEVCALCHTTAEQYARGRNVELIYGAAAADTVPR